MHVVQDPNRPARPSSYTVAGRLLFVESSDSRLEELLDQLFAGWQLTPSVITDSEPHVTIRCFCQLPFPGIPSNLDQFEIAEGGLCYLQGDSFYLDLGKALVHLSAFPKVNVDVYFKDRPNIQDPQLARALSFAVCAGLRRHGMFDVHGAGVVAPDQMAGVLIVGHSGTGKSTLAVQLAASGWDYLSDDEVLLSVVGEHVEARGFRGFFALSEKALASSFIENFERVMPSSAGSKICFEPRSVFKSKQIESAEPRILLFTSIANKVETQLVELSQRDTMTRLLRACPWATFDKPVAAQNLDVLSRLARQCVAFDLVAGTDLLIPGRADALLSPFVRNA